MIEDSDFESAPFNDRGGAGAIWRVLHSFPWRRNIPNIRECIRLHIVALASEITVLASLIEQDIIHIARDEEPPAFIQCALIHRSAALEALEGSLDRTSMESLARTLKEFRVRRNAVVSVWQRMQMLRHHSRDLSS